MVWGTSCRCASTATPSSTEKTLSGTADACRTLRHPSRVRPAQETDQPSRHGPDSAARAGFTARRDLSPRRDRSCNTIIIKTLNQVGPQEQRSSRCSYTCAHKSSLYKAARVG